MAGAIKRMATYLGLVEDDQYYTDPAEPQAAGDSERLAVKEERENSRPRSRTAAAEVSAVRPVAQPWDRAGYRIPTILPTTYNDARSIGEEFRGASPVIMDLSGMGDADAKRIVDFAAGLVFGLHGSIERITPKVFLLSPEGVDVSTTAREQVAGGSLR